MKTQGNDVMNDPSPQSHGLNDFEMLVGYTWIFKSHSTALTLGMTQVCEAYLTDLINMDVDHFTNSIQ